MKIPHLLLAILFAAVIGGCAASTVPAPVQAIAGSESQLGDPVVTRPASYVVESGDTLQEISLNVGLDYREIALWNAIANPDKIKIGQTLRLTPPPNSPSVATVRPSKLSAATATAEADAKSPDVSAPTIQPQTTLIGGGIAPAIPSSGKLIVKTSPRAEKLPYSKRNLATLQKRRITPPTPSPAALSVPKTPAKAAATAPKATRQRFGIVWSWPSSGEVLSRFSDQRKGVDIGGKEGSPVFASADGKIVYVGTGVKSYGRLVIIKHDNDYLSAYAHNRKILSAEGDRVARGQQIAEMGGSGADRVQLHFEIRKAGKPIDPLLLLPDKK